MSLTAAKNLLLKYKDLFRKTKERSMKKARTDPINIANTEAFLEMWKRNQQHMVFPMDHIVNGDETLLRAVKDWSEVVRLESRFKRGGSEVLCDSFYWVYDSFCICFRDTVVASVLSKNPPKEGFFTR